MIQHFHRHCPCRTYRHLLKYACDLAFPDLSVCLSILPSGRKYVFTYLSLFFGFGLSSLSQLKSMVPCGTIFIPSSLFSWTKSCNVLEWWLGCIMLDGQNLTNQCLAGYTLCLSTSRRNIFMILSTWNGCWTRPALHLLVLRQFVSTRIFHIFFIMKFIQ